MADISKLSRIASGVARNVALDANTLVVQNLKVNLGGANNFTFAGTLTGNRTITMPDANVNLGLIGTAIQRDGSVAFTAAQSMGGFKITSLAAGTAASDAVNKGQLDAALEGLKPKAAARVATTANIVIATALNAGDTIDGITLANGDRVLVKDQTAAEENGIYVVGATPTRSTDFDSLSPIDEINGALVAIQEGTANAGKVFVQSGTVATLDTDPISFVFFNSSATLVGGDGITVSGSNISVDHDGQGLAFAAEQLVLELDGTTLSKSASGLKVADLGISNAQISASAAIDYSKLAALTASRALVSNGSGFVSVSAVTSTELGYLSGVTSAIQTQLDGKANQQLSNLSGTTAINRPLLPDVDNGRNIGSSGSKWTDFWASSGMHTPLLRVTSAAGATVFGRLEQTLSANTPDAGGDLVALSAQYNASQRAGIASINNGDANAINTDSIFIGTGNKTAGTGSSGSIKIRTGTSAGGTRGSILLQDASLAGASVGYVWTLSNATTGAGAWTATNSAVLTVTEVAGETFAANTLFAVRYAKPADSGFAAGRMYKADYDASTADNFYAIGLVRPTSEVVATGSLTVIKNGVMNVPSHGFTTGVPLFLTAAGAISSTAPSATDQAVVRVGIVRDADNIDVNIQVVGVN